VLTKKEVETVMSTQDHIDNVRKYLQKIIDELFNRGAIHDQSKMQRPELSIFTEYTPKLAGSTYGSDEYKQFLNEMRVALEHHYANNRHHPEHFKNGVSGMNLIDIIEMFCDWKAATMRHNDGDMRKSIKINTKRFGLSQQLKSILMNTVNFIEEV